MITADEAIRIARGDRPDKFRQPQWAAKPTTEYDRSSNTYKVKFHLPEGWHGGEPAYRIDADTGEIRRRSDVE